MRREKMFSFFAPETFFNSPPSSSFFFSLFLLQAVKTKSLHKGKGKGDSEAGAAEAAAPKVKPVKVRCQ